MSPRPLHALVALAVLLGALTAAPVATAGDPCFHDLRRPAATGGSTTAVAIGDCVFGPTVTWVPVGANVTWSNTSTQAHEVAGAHLAWGAHGKLLEPGDQMDWTFDEPGVYPYSCMLHPGMTGAVVVGDPGAKAAAGVVTPGGDAAAAGADGVTGGDAGSRIRAEGPAGDGIATLVAAVTGAAAVTVLVVTVLHRGRRGRAAA